MLFCSVKDHIESFGLFSIVIHHRLDTDLIYDRETCPQEPFKISLVGDAVREDPAEVLSVYRSHIPLMQPEQHREDIVQNEAFPTTAVSDEHQPLVVGVGHPIRNLIVFRQPHEVVDGVVHLCEDSDEQSLAFIFGLAPPPAPFLSRSDLFLLDHQLDELFDSLCFHFIVDYQICHFLHCVVSQASSAVLHHHRFG